MANVIFDGFKKRVFGVDATVTAGITMPDFDTTNVSTFRASLIDHGVFTPLPQTHIAYSEVSGVIASGDLASPTGVVSAGVATFDAADKTFSTVSGASCESIVVDCHSDTAAHSVLIVYFDTATGLPVTPNGGDITVSWHSSGIFSW